MRCVSWWGRCRGVRAVMVEATLHAGRGELALAIPGALTHAHALVKEPLPYSIPWLYKIVVV